MAGDAVERLLALRLHQEHGKRSPHKPLLALIALGQLVNHGSSSLPWSEAESQLADMLAEFGPPSSTGRAQGAAYPFTRMRADGVWQLDADVPMDNVGPLRREGVSGSFAADVEAELAAQPALALTAARLLCTRHFPDTMVADVLVAAGLDPDLVLGAPRLPNPLVDARRRSATWRLAVVDAWDRQCAFCGYDGQLGAAAVGIEAAHVRWWAFGGPDDLDNGLALCSLHHKLFDRGALGVSPDLEVLVSTNFTARTPTGRALYDLHGRALRPRPGTPLPAVEHVGWHSREVFKGASLAA